MPNVLLEAALSYARRGWHVFPVEPRGKRPITANGKDDATVDESVIHAWWSSSPDANVAIAVAPSGLVVLDVDVNDGKLGRESLAVIDAELPPTLTAITGGGGLHAFYERPQGVDAFQRIGARPGIDLIGNGYVVAAPSAHASGGAYRWVDASAPTSALPPVLLTLRREAPSVAAYATSTIETGDRNNSLFRLGAALRATGIGADAVLASLLIENQRRFSPPLEEPEVHLVARSIMTRVHPERDVALGAIVADDFRAMFPGGLPTVSSGVARASELVAPMMAQSRLPVVKLPFEKLNGKLGGLLLHSITNLIAGTGKGKSSLAGQLSTWHAQHAGDAVWSGGPVVYYVGEMTREQVAARVAGQILGRSWFEVLHGAVPEADIRGALEQLPIYFVRRNDNPIAAIVEALKRANDDGVRGIPLIVVDYVQLLAAVGADMRVSTMTAVRDLQRLVEDADVISLVLSQSSRGGSSRIRVGAEHAEELGDTGAETAELERSATNQLVLSFASKDDVEEHDVTMMVTKSRFGGGSKLGFRFNGRTGLWTPLARVPEAPEHEQKCAEILLQVDAHEARRCIAGATSCGKELNQRRFRDADSPHRVSGTPKDIKHALDALVDLKEVTCVNGVYARSKRDV